MSAVFGKDISRVFFAEDEKGTPIKLPAQNPAIYIYTGRPSSDNVLNGTGSFSGPITSWSQSAVEPYGCAYSIPAITDPYPASGIPYDQYWEGVRYTAQNSGPTCISIRAFEVFRIVGAVDKPGTTLDDLIAVYPAVTNYAKDEALRAALATAEIEMRIELEGRGIDYATVQDLSKTRIPLAYKTIANVCLGQIQTPGDKHDRRYTEFSSLYSAALKQISFKFDGDSDGYAEQQAKGRAGGWLIDK